MVGAALDSGKYVPEDRNREYNVSAYMASGPAGLLMVSATCQITFANRLGTISSSAMLRRETVSHVAAGVERRKLRGLFNLSFRLRRSLHDLDRVGAAL